MTVEKIKDTLSSLSPDERREISAFLFHLRHSGDPGYQERVEARLAERDSAKWLTPKDFEEQLDAK